jgi:cell division protein FtsB
MWLQHVKYAPQRVHSYSQGIQVDSSEIAIEIRKKNRKCKFTLKNAAFAVLSLIRISRAIQSGNYQHLGKDLGNRFRIRHLQDEINRRASLHETKKNLVISYEKVHREWLEREAELTRTIANLQNESKFLELEIRNLKKELEMRSFHLAEHKRGKYYNKIFAQMQRNLVHETLRCLFDIRCRLFVFKFDY